MLKNTKAPEPGTKFLRNDKEYVVVPWDPKRDGYKTKVVAHEPGCKDHVGDWCLGMDIDAWLGHLERGTIITFTGERPAMETRVQEVVENEE